MTSSSILGPGFEPFHGRLSGASGNGSWCGENTDTEAYLEIDLGDRFQISMIAVQGNEVYEWTFRRHLRVNCRYEFTLGTERLFDWAER